MSLLRTKTTPIRLLGKPEEPEEKQNEKISAEAAGYMELAGAKKTGGCLVVNVDGGISKELGCCNLFKPETAQTSQFRCGTCHFED